MEIRLDSSKYNSHDFETYIKRYKHCHTMAALVSGFWNAPGYWLTNVVMICKAKEGKWMENHTTHCPSLLG